MNIIPSKLEEKTSLRSRRHLQVTRFSLFLYNREHSRSNSPYGQGQGQGQGRFTPTAPPSVAPAGCTFQLVPVQEEDQALPGTVTQTAPSVGYGDLNVPASMQYCYEIRDIPQQEKTDDLPPSYSDVMKQ